MKTQAATSAFAKSRTLKEQREYLPAFACREELMGVIRDNQGKVATITKGLRGLIDYIQLLSSSAKPVRGRRHS